ncbi:MAG TPA: integrase core domain-containing protein [Solirubrobacteraceae bacterium]|nr:integrase core domain-containing protein [Solirubrobacteraceae bacterium]
MSLPLDQEWEPTKPVSAKPSPAHDSHERTAALDGWLWTYNHRRPHGALSHQPPIARLNELNNLPGSYN